MLGRSWADARQIQTFLLRAASTTRHDSKIGNKFLGRCWAEAGQILGGAWAGQSWSDAASFLGWRFWEDLVRCWPNVFNLGALPVPMLSQV